jgi:hypothetical protein
MRTREEHLEWCKQRAREYLDAGELANAVASMGSDLEKHPETRFSPTLVAVGMLYVMDGDRQAVRRWVEGFR